MNVKPILFQLGLLKILQCHRGESPDRRGSGGSGRSSSGSADSFQVSIPKLFYFGVLSEIRHSKQFLLWNFHIYLVYSQLFGESFLFLPDNHHQTAVSQPIQQCSIVPKKENSTVGLQGPEITLEFFLQSLIRVLTKIL